MSRRGRSRERDGRREERRGSERRRERSGSSRDRRRSRSRSRERRRRERSRSREKREERRDRRRSRSNSREKRRSRSRERKKRFSTPYSVHGAALLKMQRGEDMQRYAEQHVASFDEFAWRALFSHLHKRLRGQLNDESLEIVKSICEHMEDRISSFREGRTLSSIIYGLCKLRVEPSARFLKLWSEQCVALMSTLDPQALSNVVYALGQLELESKQLCASFFLKWSEACVVCISKFNTQDHLNCIYALGKLKLDRHDSARISLILGPMSAF